MDYSKLHAAGVSIFCSAMLLSNIPLPHNAAYKFAAVASGDVFAQKEVTALQSFARDGWTAGVDVSALTAPAPVAAPRTRTPAKVSALQAQDLAQLANYVLSNGKDYDFNGTYAKWLGLGDDESKTLPSKIVEIDGDTYNHYIYALQRGDQVDLVFKYGVRDQFKETWVYRATLDGAFVAGIHVHRFEVPHVVAMTPAEATPLLADQETYWLGQVPSTQMAGQP